jgi:hypothetical protein
LFLEISMKLENRNSKKGGKKIEETVSKKLKKKQKKKIAHTKKKKLTKKKKIKKIGELKKAFFEGSDLEGGGVFCFMPYDFLDKYRMQNFKLQSSSNIHNENFKEYYPNGFSMIAWLLSPDKERRKYSVYLDYYTNIINFILLTIKQNGGQTPDLVNGNETGWIYCSIEQIHDAFKTAQSIYGGLFTPFDLVGTSIKTGEFISKTVDDNIITKPQFVGKMVYHT